MEAVSDAESTGRTRTEVTSEATNNNVTKKRRNFTEDHFKKIFPMFMSFLNETTYDLNDTATFTEEQIRSITPSDIVKFFNYKTFGSVEPSEETFDRTKVVHINTSSSALIYWKKAISYFLPSDEAKRKWNPKTKSGNPTKSPEVDNILEIVKQKEQLLSHSLKSKEATSNARRTRNISKRPSAREEAQHPPQKDWEAGSSSDDDNYNDFYDDNEEEQQLDPVRNSRRRGEISRRNPPSQMNFSAVPRNDGGVHVGVAIRQIQEQLDEMQFQLTELQGTVQNLVSRQEADRVITRDHLHTIVTSISDISRAITSFGPSGTGLQQSHQSAVASSAIHTTSIGKSRKRKGVTGPTATTQPRKRIIDSGPGAKVDENSKVFEQISPNATLISSPSTLYLLWEEYIKGVNGRKPAREFNRWERGRVSNAYSHRKTFWELVEKFVSAGHTSDEAIRRIYNVYGENSGLTKIILGIKRDLIEDTLHDTLRV